MAKFRSLTKKEKFINPKSTKSKKEKMFQESKKPYPSKRPFALTIGSLNNKPI